MPRAHSIRRFSTCSSGIVPSTPRNWSPRNRSTRCSRRSKSNYGYGWSIDKKFDLARHVHGGGIPGFVTIIERFPQEKLLVVVLSNFETTRIGRIGDDLAAIALGRPYVVPHEPKPAKVDRATFWLPTPAGTSPIAATGKEKPPITVTADGDTLRVEIKGQGRLIAVPETATQFYLKGADATVEFTKDASGDVTHLTLLQNNQYLKAVKTEPPGAAQLPGEAKQSPAANAGPKPAPSRGSQRSGSQAMSPPNIPPEPEMLSLDRRGFLAQTGGGFGALALAHLLGTDATRGDDGSSGWRERAHPEWNGGLHHRAAPRESCSSSCPARPVSATPSITSRFSIQQNGQKFDPGGKVELFQSEPGAIMASPWKWRQLGQCGKWVSDLVPHLAGCVDDIAFLPAMVAKSNVHGPATFMQNTGFVLPGFPSMGAWVSYGLGNLSQNLPSFVVLPDSRGFAPNGPANWSAGFLPAANQGTMVRPGAKSPIFDLFPPDDCVALRRGADRGPRTSRALEPGRTRPFDPATRGSRPASPATRWPRACS